MLDLLSGERNSRKEALEKGIANAAMVEEELELRHDFFDIMKVSFEREVHCAVFGMCVIVCPQWCQLVTLFPNHFSNSARVVPLCYRSIA